jgi:hypothetical protein
MSTNIDDLPGPKDEINMENLDNLDEIEGFEQAIPNNPTSTPNITYTPNSIKMDIKKISKDSNDESIFDIIKSEVNETNLLILVLFFIASISFFDEYIKKLLASVSFNTNTLTLAIIKSILLLLIFILAKYWLLPYIKV